MNANHHPASTKYIIEFDIRPIVVSVRKITVGMIDLVPSKGTNIDKKSERAAQDDKAEPSTAMQKHRLVPHIGVIQLKK
ncbi:hypothetical protein [Fibrobacter sp.]|uniref:hypothetical protein n=1 Tax=Fibrobacter sp. TaxID=35828 RepID=UPI0025BCE3B1|nr:hypothetical protein [Fibrobacter sp.]MBR2863752.1 hypothetical protein [Bacteroidaceae bacterium]MBR6124932.1 hypothetical protein [Candidatus Saccharibacteria bacterium]MBR3071500.1 hypothetical protein [Fibrobacter sp.]MBR3851298.1 hypothetical protein [Fibrobacter sp.]MBR4008426.1 hypothetical protein [Fibrobacter sp.]